MTPSGPFMVTRTSRANHSLRLQTFHSMSELFLSHAKTVFYHTRTSARRARGPSSFARITPSRTRTIFILEDPGGYFRVTFASRVTLLSTSGPFLIHTFFTISIMTCANRVDSLVPLNGSVTSASRADFFRSRGPLLLTKWTFLVEIRIRMRI